MPFGPARKLLALWRHVWVQWSYYVMRRVKLRWRIWFGERPPRGAPKLVKQAIAS